MTVFDVVYRLPADRMNSYTGDAPRHRMICPFNPPFPARTVLKRNDSRLTCVASFLEACVAARGGEPQRGMGGAPLILTHSLEMRKGYAIMMNVKTRKNKVLQDCTKSALGFGALCWIFVALICPIIQLEYSETRQLIVLGLGAATGAALSFALREDDASS